MKTLQINLGLNNNPMNLENKILVDSIVFLKEDTFKETLIKTVQIWAGTHRLKTELAKHKVDYVKIEKVAMVKYILRGAQIGRIEVNL